MFDQPPSDDTLIRIEDAAPQLHLRPTALRRSCAAGCIPALKIGKRWLIRAGTLRGIMRGEIAYTPRQSRGAA